MWEPGASDAVNVKERVIVPAASMESGQWKVTVSAKQLLAVQGVRIGDDRSISISEYHAAQADEAGETATTSGSEACHALMYAASLGVCYRCFDGVLPVSLGGNVRKVSMVSCIRSMVPYEFSVCQCFDFPGRRLP